MPLSVPDPAARPQLLRFCPNYHPPALRRGGPFFVAISSRVAPVSLAAEAGTEKEEEPPPLFGPFTGVIEMTLGTFGAACQGIGDFLGYGGAGLTSCDAMLTCADKLAVRRHWWPALSL